MVPGADLDSLDGRSPEWLMGFAAQPLGGLAHFLGTWLAGTVFAAIVPGWIVIALVSTDSPGWWTTGWDRWGPVVWAHLFTGLLLAFGLRLAEIHKQAREWVAAWEDEELPPA